MNLKEDINQIEFEDIFEDIEEILTGDMIKNIHNIPLRENSVLVVFASILTSLQRKESPDSILYNEINSLLYYINNTIKNNENKYKVRADNGVLINSFKVKDGITKLYVINDVYEKYLENKYGLKPIVGAFLSPLVESVNRDIKNTEIYVNIKRSDVETNKTRFTELADDYNKTLLLTRQNTDISKLRTYFIFGILDNKYTDKIERLTELDKEAMKKHISKLNLVELGEVEKTVVELYKKYTYKTSNLKIFLEAMEEAEFLLGKSCNPKTAAGYGALKLITLYLAGQTTII